jgi:hypothetical protein
MTDNQRKVQKVHPSAFCNYNADSKTFAVYYVITSMTTVWPSPSTPSVSYVALSASHESVGEAWTEAAARLEKVSAEAT